MNARLLTLIAVAGLLAATAGWHRTLAAQAPAQTASQTPEVTFQVEVSYVDVDVVVTDDNGRFLSGLMRNDFEVFEDGKPQTLEMFSYVELPVEPPDRFLFLNRPVSSDARTNRRAFDGRVYVLVLDDLDISPLRTSFVKKAARDFVERHLGANDIASVVYTSGRSDAIQDFTSDRNLLLAAIDKFIGRRLRPAAVELLERHYQRELTRGVGDSERPDPSAVTDSRAPFDIRDLEREQRTLAVLDTLRNLGEFLSGVRGRRKAVLLFSEGVEMPMSELQSALHTPTDVVGAIRDAVTAAARSNVSFFALDPRGLIGLTSEYIELAGSGAPDVATGAFGALNAQQGLLSEMRLSQDSLRTLAEQTGGFAAVNTNDLNSAFERIVDANSRYYVLGYYPPDHQRDGRFHEISVRVKRPGARVVARGGYASPRRSATPGRRERAEARRLGDVKRAGANNTSPELRGALNAPLQQSGLALSLQAAPFRQKGNEASVALAIEIDGDRLAFASRDNGAIFASSLELSYFGINQEGRALRATRSELNLNLKPETYQRVKTGGLRLNPRLVLDAGRYQIRVGVRDTAAGRVGTVFYDLQVPDFQREPLMLSGLLLTASSSNGGMTAQPDAAAPKLLPGPATSRRIFSSDDVLTVFAEMYDNMPARQSRQIAAAVTLTSEQGTDVFNARETVDNPSGAGHWTAYAVSREIPLRDVAPGRYLLRIEARAQGTSHESTVLETLVSVNR